MPVHKNFKVCLVSISLAKGGAERSCAMLSEMLSSKGHEVHIVILNDEIDYPYNGKLFNLGKFKSEKDLPLQRFLRFRKLRRFLKHESFDVIIDHRTKNNYKREMFYANYIYRKLKTIYVVHSSNTSEYLTEEPLKFVGIYKKNIFNVAVSKYIEKNILNEMHIENSICIPNAYDPKWENQGKGLPDILKDKTYILSYGRLDDKIKDISFLINAFSESKLWEKNIYLVILGDGTDKIFLQELANKTMALKNIIFLPFTSSPFQIIKDARCVSLTSKYEGFPMVLVEALSLGTPVVTLDIVSGPSEIIEDSVNGLLIAERNLSLFAQALQKLCLEEKFYQKIKANTKSSVLHFSKEAIGEKWNLLLQNEI